MKIPSFSAIEHFVLRLILLILLLLGGARLVREELKAFGHAPSAVRNAVPPQASVPLGTRERPPNYGAAAMET